MDRRSRGAPHGAPRDDGVLSNPIMRSGSNRDVMNEAPATTTSVPPPLPPLPPHQQDEPQRGVVTWRYWWGLHITTHFHDPEVEDAFLVHLAFPWLAHVSFCGVCAVVMFALMIITPSASSAFPFQVTGLCLWSCGAVAFLSLRWFVTPRVQRRRYTRRHRRTTATGDNVVGGGELQQHATDTAVKKAMQFIRKKYDGKLPSKDKNPSVGAPRKPTTGSGGAEVVGEAEGCSCSAASPSLEDSSGSRSDASVSSLLRGPQDQELRPIEVRGEALTNSTSNMLIDMCDSLLPWAKLTEVVVLIFAQGGILFMEIGSIETKAACHDQTREVAMQKCYQSFGKDAYPMIVQLAFTMLGIARWRVNALGNLFGVAIFIVMNVIVTPLYEASPNRTISSMIIFSVHAIVCVMLALRTEASNRVAFVVRWNLEVQCDEMRAATELAAITASKEIPRHVLQFVASLSHMQQKHQRSVFGVVCCVGLKHLPQWGVWRAPTDLVDFLLNFASVFEAVALRTFISPKGNGSTSNSNIVVTRVNTFGDQLVYVFCRNGGPNKSTSSSSLSPMPKPLAHVSSSLHSTAVVNSSTNMLLFSGDSSEAAREHQQHTTSTNQNLPTSPYDAQPRGGTSTKSRNPFLYSLASSPSLIQGSSAPVHVALPPSSSRRLLGQQEQSTSLSIMYPSGLHHSNPAAAAAPPSATSDVFQLDTPALTNSNKRILSLDMPFLGLTDNENVDAAEHAKVALETEVAALLSDGKLANAMVDACQYLWFTDQRRQFVHKDSRRVALRPVIVLGSGDVELACVPSVRAIVATGDCLVACTTLLGDLISPLLQHGDAPMVPVVTATARNVQAATSLKRSNVVTGANGPLARRSLSTVGGGGGGSGRATSASANAAIAANETPSEAPFISELTLLDSVATTTLEGCSPPPQPPTAVPIHASLTAHQQHVPLQCNHHNSNNNFIVSSSNDVVHIVSRTTTTTTKRAATEVESEFSSPAALLSPSVASKLNVPITNPSSDATTPVAATVTFNVRSGESERLVIVNDDDLADVNLRLSTYPMRLVRTFQSPETERAYRARFSVVHPEATIAAVTFQSLPVVRFAALTMLFFELANIAVLAVYLRDPTMFTFWIFSSPMHSASPVTDATPGANEGDVRKWSAPFPYIVAGCLVALVLLVVIVPRFSQTKQRSSLSLCEACFWVYIALYLAPSLLQQSVWNVIGGSPIPWGMMAAAVSLQRPLWHSPLVMWSLEVMIACVVVLRGCVLLSTDSITFGCALAMATFFWRVVLDYSAATRFAAEQLVLQQKPVLATQIQEVSKSLEGIVPGEALQEMLQQRTQRRLRRKQLAGVVTAPTDNAPNSGFGGRGGRRSGRGLAEHLSSITHKPTEQSFVNTLVSRALLTPFRTIVTDPFRSTVMATAVEERAICICNFSFAAGTIQDMVDVAAVVRSTLEASKSLTVEKQKHPARNAQIQVALVKFNGDQLMLAASDPKEHNPPASMVAAVVEKASVMLRGLVDKFGSSRGFAFRAWAHWGPVVGALVGEYCPTFEWHSPMTSLGCTLLRISPEQGSPIGWNMMCLESQAARGLLECGSSTDVESRLGGKIGPRLRCKVRGLPVFHIHVVNNLLDEIEKI